MCKRKILQSQKQAPSFTQCHSYTAKVWHKWANRHKICFCLMSLRKDGKNPIVYNICFSLGRAKLLVEMSNEGLHSTVVALSCHQLGQKESWGTAPHPPSPPTAPLSAPQLLPPLYSVHTERADTEREGKGLMWNSCRQRNAECLHVKQFEKQQYKLISKSVIQMNCFAVCFDIEWILAVHMRTAFHEQQFDSCSMIWISFSGVPHWAITCLQFG